MSIAITQQAQHREPHHLLTQSPEDQYDYYPGNKPVDASVSYSPSVRG